MINSATRNYLIRRFVLGPVLRVSTHGAAFAGICLPWLRNVPSRPVFIVGCSRSGTTLFSEVFGARGDVCNVMDASQVWDLDYYDKSGDDHRDENDANFWETSRIRSSFAVRQIVCGGGRLVNKNNQNSLRLRYLKALFPDAFVIHVIRDARPVVLSNISRVEKDVYRRGFPFGRFPKPVAWRSYVDHPMVEQFAHQWHDITELVRKDGEQQFGAGQYLEIRFEDFCTSPEQILEQVDRFCGFVPAPRPEVLLATISPQQSTSWESTLVMEDLQRIEQITAPQLASFGYRLRSGA